MSYKRLIGMKINRYTSLTGWVRVLSEGLLCQWWWPEWHERLSLRETLLGQDKGGHLMSYLRWMHVIFFPLSSCCLNCSETANSGIYLISIWTFNKKSEEEKREGHAEPIWLPMRHFISSFSRLPWWNLWCDNYYQAADSGCVCVCAHLKA